jgi:hypothetical protein
MAKMSMTGSCVSIDRGADFRVTKNPYMQEYGIQCDAPCSEYTIYFREPSDMMKLAACLVAFINDRAKAGDSDFVCDIDALQAIADKTEE